MAIPKNKRVRHPMADKPHEFQASTSDSPVAQCGLCGEYEAEPCHVAPAVDLPPVEVKPLAAPAVIRTGFNVTTRLVIRDTFQYMKEWKLVADSEAQVRDFFKQNTDLGEVMKVEDRGPIMVLNA
jgi:hypothetical protein